MSKNEIVFDDSEYSLLLKELISLAKDSQQIEYSLIGEVALDYKVDIEQINKAVKDLTKFGITVIKDDLEIDDKFDENDFSNIDGVSIFLNEISKKPLLSYNEEIELAQKIAQGDEDAKNKLIECNLRLVIYIAKKYKNSGLPFGDLISDGNIGLITAAVKYNPSLGCRFSTYATCWIRQSITRDISEHLSIIRMPVYIGEKIKRMRRIEQTLEQTLGREPTEIEVAASLGVSVPKLRNLKLISLQPRSIYEEVGEDGNSILLDFYEDENAVRPDTIVENEFLKEFLDNMIKTLSPREMKVIKLRYGLEDGRARTLEEVGDFFHVSRERIRQVEIKALKKLRRLQVLKQLKSYTN